MEHNVLAYISYHKLLKVFHKECQYEVSMLVNCCLDVHQGILLHFFKLIRLWLMDSSKSVFFTVFLATIMQQLFFYS